MSLRSEKSCNLLKFICIHNPMKCFVSFRVTFIDHLSKWASHGEIFNILRIITNHYSAFINNSLYIWCENMHGYPRKIFVPRCEQFSESEAWGKLWASFASFLVFGICTRTNILYNVNENWGCWPPLLQRISNRKWSSIGWKGELIKMRSFRIFYEKYRFNTWHVLVE